MNPLDLMEAKYERMQQAKTPAERALVHDAANCAMAVVGSESGLVAWGRRVNLTPSAN